MPELRQRWSVFRRSDANLLRKSLEWESACAVPTGHAAKNPPDVDSFTDADRLHGAGPAHTLQA